MSQAPSGSGKGGRHGEERPQSDVAPPLSLSVRQPLSSGHRVSPSSSPLTRQQPLQRQPGRPPDPPTMQQQQQQAIPTAAGGNGSRGPLRRQLSRPSALDTQVAAKATSAPLAAPTSPSMSMLYRLVYLDDEPQDDDDEEDSHSSPHGGGNGINPRLAVGRNGEGAVAHGGGGGQAQGGGGGGGLAGLVSPRHYQEDEKPPAPERCTCDHFVEPGSMTVADFLARCKPVPSHDEELQVTGAGGRPCKISRLAVRNARRQDTAEDLYRFLELQQQGVDGHKAPAGQGGSTAVVHPHHSDARSRKPLRFSDPQMEGVLTDMWRDWQRLKRTQQSTAEALFDLGKRFGYGSGQWVIYVGREEANRLWERVARAAHRGLLGPLVQVTTVHEDHLTRWDNKGSPKQRALSPTRKHSILVTVDPYWHQPEVDRVLRVLRQQCGIRDRPLRFVPDFVESLGRLKNGEHDVGLAEASFYDAKMNDTFSVRAMGTGKPLHVAGSPTVHERRPGEDRKEFHRRLLPSATLNSSAALQHVAHSLYLEHADSVRDVDEFYEELLVKKEVCMSIYTDGVQPVMDHINAEWAEVLMQQSSLSGGGDGGSKALEEVIWDLGRRYGYGRGRWRLSIDVQRMHKANAQDPSKGAKMVDIMWERITQSLCEGGLGTAAEVSGPTLSDWANYTISVVVDPYWDHAKVDRALQEIRALGFTDRLSFYADITSELGYSHVNNPLGLRLHVYEAAELASTSTKTRPAPPSSSHGGTGTGQPVVEGRHQFTCRDTETVENFLRRVKPSSEEVEGHAIVMSNMQLRSAWIAEMARVFESTGVLGSSSLHRPVPEQAGELSQMFRRSWQEVDVPSREALWSLAKRHGLGLAYWRIRPERAAIDGLWAKVARAVDRGKMGAEARCITCRLTVETAEEGVEDVVVVSEISFALYPFWDRSQVDRTLAAIRQDLGYQEQALLVIDTVDSAEVMPDGGGSLALYEAGPGVSVPHCLVGAITEVRQPNESGAAFLRRLKPSEADELTAWIETRNPAMVAFVEEAQQDRTAQGLHIVPSSCTGMEQVKLEWEALVADGKQSREQLWLLGKRYGISSGYWTWEVRAEQMDEVWALVTAGTDENLLGPTARIFPGATGDAINRRVNICVQVDPYWNTEEVQMVLSRLRAPRDVVSYGNGRRGAGGLGITARLVFYPEVALRMDMLEAFYEADERSDVATCVLLSQQPSSLQQQGGEQHHHDDGNLLSEKRLDEEPIDSFLRRLRPSDGDGVVQWYCINNAERTLMIQRQYAALVDNGTLPCSIHTHGPTLLEQIQLAWENGRLQGLWSNTDNESLFLLGQQFGFGCGRWVMLVPVTEVDRVWARVAVETEQGNLGFFAEVAPARARHCVEGHHTVNIYVDPYWDVMEVQRTLQVIRNVLDVGIELHFVPEIARTLHLRTQNPYNLCTTFYYAPAYALDMRRTTCNTHLPISYRNANGGAAAVIGTTIMGGSTRYASSYAPPANAYLSPRTAASRGPWAAAPSRFGTAPIVGGGAPVVGGWDNGGGGGGGGGNAGYTYSRLPPASAVYPTSAQNTTITSANVLAPLPPPLLHSSRVAVGGNGGSAITSQGPTVLRASDLETRAYGGKIVDTGRLPAELQQPPPPPSQADVTALLMRTMASSTREGGGGGGGGANSSRASGSSAVPRFFGSS